MIDPAARARLEAWKLSLLDLSAANRLLDIKDGKTTIPLPAVDPLRVAAALAEGAAFTVASSLAAHLDAGGASDAGTLRSPLAAPELAQRLVAIRRAARAQLADGGVHTLWLGLGLLTWCADAPDAVTGERVVRTAPLALWPVELERAAGGALRLVEAAGLEPRWNLTLGEKLRREFDAVLATGGDELDLAALLDAAEAWRRTG